MDLTVLGQILTFASGVASAGIISWLQQRHAASARREERDADDRRRREEREEKRRTDELDSVRDLYRRVAQLGMEYRWVEGIAQNQWEHWQRFVPRFHEVRAELAFRGSPEVREAFKKYMDHVQATQAEADQLGYVEEFWEHHDQAMDELTALMRQDLDRRMRAGTLDELVGAVQPQLERPEPRRLPPGEKH